MIFSIRVLVVPSQIFDTVNSTTQSTLSVTQARITPRRMASDENFGEDFSGYLIRQQQSWPDEQYIIKDQNRVWLQLSLR